MLMVISLLNSLPKKGDNGGFFSVLTTDNKHGKEEMVGGSPYISKENSFIFP